MTFSLEYHGGVRRSIPASLAVMGMLFLSFLSFAQVNSAVASGSSGSHSFSAPITSSVSHGYAPANPGATFSTSSTRSMTSSPHSPIAPHVPRYNPAPHGPGSNPSTSSRGPVYYPYFYAVPVPFPYAVLDAGAYNPDVDDTDVQNNAVENNAVQSSDTPADNNDADDQGGPTIFDRRGSEADSSVAPTSSDDPPAVAQAVTALVSEAPQVPTTLVFKDGHQLEVDNYAIVGQTLYDLAPGHARRVALADLDLSATQKQNDDRGVTFQPPSSAQAN